MRKEISVCFLALALVVSLAGIARGYPLTAALNSMQVVPQNSSTARGSCRIDGTYGGDPYPGSLYFDLNCDFSGLSGPIINADIRYQVAGQNGAGLCLDSKQVIVTPPNTGTGTARITCPTGGFWFETWATKDFYVVLQTSNFPDGEIRGQIKPTIPDADVDGEGRTEVSVFRPSDGVSYSYCNMTNGTIGKQLAWDQQASTPFLADLDNDGIADWAYTRTVPWWGIMVTFYKSSRTDELLSFPFGNANYDAPLLFGDYDGDGRIGVAAFRPSNGTWQILENVEDLNQVRTDYWGIPGDTPCAGDYDGDGKTDLCVTRPEYGQLVWYIRRSSDGYFFRVPWGLVTDAIYPRNPVDIDGDGSADPLVSRVEDGKRVFYALRSYGLSWFVLQWGLSTDTVKLGDYDNDGKTDFAAIREIDNQLVWFINQSSDGQMRVNYWGLPGDN
jgi:hypothetical protein